MRFQAGFPVNPGNWEEAVQVSYKKRTLWTLWLLEETKYKTEYETRSSDNAKIPSVEDLLGNWIIQAKEVEPEIVNQITSWLLEQINCLKKNVSQVQNNVIDRYQSRLDKAHQEITLNYEKQRSVWQPMHQKANNIVEEFSSLGIMLKKEI